MSFYAQVHASCFTPQTVKDGFLHVDYTCMTPSELRRRCAYELAHLNHTLGHDSGYTVQGVFKDLVSRLIQENEDLCPKPLGQRGPCGIYLSECGNEFEVYPEGLGVFYGASLAEAFANAKEYYYSVHLLETH